jgi:ectoine hydroxylase-related dioxygenase (phytanoyl-CoA dioxygenase family)
MWLMNDAEALFKSGGAEMLNSSAKQASTFGSGLCDVTRDGGPTMLVPDSRMRTHWSNMKVRMAADYSIDKNRWPKLSATALQTRLSNVLFSH